MPTLSGLTSVEFDRLKVKKPEGGLRQNIYDVFVRRPEHIGRLVNNRFEAVDDTHIVSTNAIDTEYCGTGVRNSAACSTTIAHEHRKCRFGRYQGPSAEFVGESDAAEEQAKCINVCVCDVLADFRQEV